MSEGSAYTDFTVCIIILHHIRKQPGWVKERKTRSPTLSVPQRKEGQRSALNYHQLTEINLLVRHLLVKSSSSLMGVLFGWLFYLKFPRVHLNINNQKEKEKKSCIGVLSSINCDISGDKTVIKHKRGTDLSFRSDSSIAVPSPGGVRRYMSAVIDSSQRCQLAAGKLQGKIRTSISVVPNGRPGSWEGSLQTWWYQYLVGLGSLFL